MKRHLYAYSIWTATAAISVLYLSAKASGFWWNTTASVPRGLWRVLSAVPTRNAIVLVCPPDTPVFQTAHQAGIVPSGPCPGNYAPLLKPAAALPGDTVDIEGEGIRVNSRLLSNSQPLRILLAGQPVAPVPAGHYRVLEGQVWLVSEFHPNSFDSRYFGPLPLAAIGGVAEPVWLLEN